MFFRTLTPLSRSLLASQFSTKTTKHHSVVVVGGGCGGLAVANNLKRRLPSLDVAIIEPSPYHYYQPAWTLVGAGLYDKYHTVRPEENFIPQNSTWLRQPVLSFDPTSKAIHTTDHTIHYDFLVIATGIKLYLDAIEGLRATLGKNGVSTNYSFDYCDKTWELIKAFRGGKALFTQPATPIKCGGAPQKIMYLAEDWWRRQETRNFSTVTFVSGSPKLFVSPHYAAALAEICQKRNIETVLSQELVKVDGEQRKAYFKAGDEIIERDFDFLHVTPPMGPVEVVRNSPLANAAGFVDVDQFTLRHKKYEEVFALGDCSSLPTSKTAAAISGQSGVLVKNLMSALENKPLSASYDGYTSCPIPTKRYKLMLAEFDYSLEPKETFGPDQRKESFPFFLMKKYLIPLMYWDYLIKGLWEGPSSLKFSLNRKNKK